MLNIGTAVMGPEVYLKALAMARNVAAQAGHKSGASPRPSSTCATRRRTTAAGGAEKTDPSYYFRPYKTVVVRTVADGGASYYVQGDHGSTVPALYYLIMEP